MCIIGFMKDSHPDYPFIFIANRDEAYDRPASPIHRWTDASNVTAGVDLKAKGTWLGYTAEGKFIAVLNYPFIKWESSLPKPRSRGQLLRDYLTTDISVEDFEAQLQATRTEYDSYHLVFGTFDELKYYSNVEGTIHSLNTGMHVLVNTLDDLSAHRKERLEETFQEYMDNQPHELNLDELLALMQDEEKSETMTNFPKELDEEVAKRHSSIFIRGKEFGTVGSTVMLLDKNGKMTVKELKYDRTGVFEKTTLEQQLNLTSLKD